MENNTKVVGWILLECSTKTNAPEVSRNSSKSWYSDRPSGKKCGGRIMMMQNRRQILNSIEALIKYMENCLKVQKNISNCIIEGPPWVNNTWCESKKYGSGRRSNFRIYNKDQDIVNHESYTSSLGANIPYQARKRARNSQLETPDVVFTAN